MATCFLSNDTATTETYTLSLHDALPISPVQRSKRGPAAKILVTCEVTIGCIGTNSDRKSTRLNSSHTVISYAVFCLKKKKHHDHARLAPRNQPPRRHQARPRRPLRGRRR